MFFLSHSHSVQRLSKSEFFKNSKFYVRLAAHVHFRGFHHITVRLLPYYKRVSDQKLKIHPIAHVLHSLPILPLPIKSH